jgi:purine-nucleoside phosphorylase
MEGRNQIAYRRFAHIPAEDDRTPHEPRPIRVSGMPARLRPTAPIAADAILVGDPGRALMLAQELLQQPKMSNHARGLWGYSGVTHAGHALSVQSTGMGGPSATVVLQDLAELGVRRAIRIGTAAGLSHIGVGQMLIATEARTEAGETSRPDPELTGRLRRALVDAQAGVVVSLEALHDPERQSPTLLADVADMQTAALLGAGARLGVAVAALLIVTERGDAGQLRDEESELLARRAGTAASRILST